MFDVLAVLDVVAVTPLVPSHPVLSPLFGDLAAHASDRTTPAHLCLGALAGLAAAQGWGDLFAIAAKAHPSYDIDTAARFDTASGAF